MIQSLFNHCLKRKIDSLQQYIYVCFFCCFFLISQRIVSNAACMLSVLYTCCGESKYAHKSFTNKNLVYFFQKSLYIPAIEQFQMRATRLNGTLLL